MNPTQDKQVVKPLKELSQWDFPDTVWEPNGYNQKEIPEATTKNFNTLLEHYNTLVNRVNVLYELKEIELRGNEMTIKTQKQHHKEQMDDYGKQYRDYVEKYGNDNCEWLIHRRIMESYHRGAWNALNELEKEK